MTEKGIAAACRLLPMQIAELINKMPCDELTDICEIRLRIGRRPVLTCIQGSKLLSGGVIVTRGDIDTVIARAFRNSLHSSAVQLRAGFATYENGCRVGFSGTAVSDSGQVENIKNISSVCIRISREVIGCSNSIFSECMLPSPSGVLLCGAPSSGKTTFLRDLARLCGSVYRTALIDERSELAAVSSGCPSCDIGLMTDVLDAYPRGAAVETAVRVLSPQVIVCDEIGSEEDIYSLSYAMRSGVRLAASCHCDELDALMEKPNICKLISGGVFNYAVLLAGHRLISIRTLGKTTC